MITLPSKGQQTESKGMEHRPETPTSFDRLPSPIVFQPFNYAITDTTKYGECMRQMFPLPVQCYTPHECKTPAPTLVLLHGKNMTGKQMIKQFKPWSDQYGVMLLAPQVSSTWDSIQQKRITDVDGEVIRGAISASKYDPKRIGIAGFSDGAAVAIGIGRNKDMPFTHVLAMSPGGMFSTTASQVDKVDTTRPVVIHHGIHDQVLPLKCAEYVDKQLTDQKTPHILKQGTYQHAMNTILIKEFVKWFVSGNVDPDSL